MQLKDNSGFIRERTKPKVIRYRRYNLDIDADNYYREQLMLFYPWRNEQTDILDINRPKIFLENRDIIIENYEKYNAFQNDENLEEILKDIENENDDFDDDSNQIDNDQVIIDDEYLPYNIQEPKDDVFVIQNNDSTTIDTISTVVKLPPLMSEIDFLNIIRSLNDKQRNYLTLFYTT